MKARHAIAAIMGLALTSAALFFGFGVGRETPSPSGVDGVSRAVLAASKAEPAGVSGASVPEPSGGLVPKKDLVPKSGEPGQVSGVADIDPHKAFGSKNAPIVMEVFSDYQCPACKQLYKTTNQPLLDNYVNTNKVYLVHRDFPLPMHAYSRVAASYARAAAHIGKGETVEQALFQNQEKWQASGDVKGTVVAVLSAAEMKKVQALVDGKTLEPLIEKDKQAGLLVPVNQTPTTVFRSKGQTYPYAGIMSYDILKQFLDQLLSQK